MHREPLARVGPAAGALADHPATGEVLHVEGDLLAAGEGGARGEHDERLVGAEAVRVHRVGPALAQAVEPRLHVDQPHRFVADDVAHQQLHRVGVAAAALAHVEHEGVGVGDQRHGGAHGTPRRRCRCQDRADHEVRDVAGEPLDPAHPAGRGEGHPVPVGLERLGVVGGRHPVGVVDEPQVQVVRDVLQVGAQGVGQGCRAEVVVGTRGGAGPQPGGGLLPDVGQHEPLGDEVGAAGDDLGGRGGSGGVRLGGLHAPSLASALTERQSLLTLDCVDPTDDLLDVTDPERLRVLGHPMRMRLLLSVGAEGATVSQLSARLGTNKGNVAHHLAVLERAGLVRRGRTRTVRGGTEQYFERVARRVRTSSGAASGHTAAMLQTVADEMDAAPGDPLLHLRRVRMPPQQAAALEAHLDRLVADLPQGRATDPVVSVLVGLYRSAGPG